MGSHHNLIERRYRGDVLFRVPRFWKYLHRNPIDQPANPDTDLDTDLDPDACIPTGGLRRRLFRLAGTLQLVHARSPNNDSPAYNAEIIRTRYDWFQPDPATNVDFFASNDTVSYYWSRTTSTRGAGRRHVSFSAATSGGPRPTRSFRRPPRGTGRSISTAGQQDFFGSYQVCVDIEFDDAADTVCPNICASYGGPGTPTPTPTITPTVTRTPTQQLTPSNTPTNTSTPTLAHTNTYLHTDSVDVL